MHHAFMSSPSQLTFLANSPKLVRFTNNTRSSSNECFYVKASKTESIKKSFVRIGVSIWNSIPYSVKCLGKSKFRNKIKQILLETLELENDYMEVSQLLNYFSNLS